MGSVSLVDMNMFGDYIIKLLRNTEIEGGKLMH